MQLKDRLLALGELWERLNERSTATLATRVAKDGKTFERLRNGGSISELLLERFFAYFRTADAWPGGTVPTEATALLDGVDLGTAHSADNDSADARASSGNADDISASAQVPA